MNKPNDLDPRSDLRDALRTLRKYKQETEAHHGDEWWWQQLAAAEEALGKTVAAMPDRWTRNDKGELL